MIIYSSISRCKHLLLSLVIILCKLVGVNEVFGKLAVCLQSRSTQLRQSGRIDDSFGEPVSLTDPPIERIDAKRACNRC